MFTPAMVVEKVAGTPVGGFGGWPVRARRVPQGRGRAVALVEALHRLGSAGYVRTFEAAGNRLWCRSCETFFEPGELVVETMVAVVTGGTVLALRSFETGAAGTWLVGGASEIERQLLARLKWVAPRSHRASAGRPCRGGERRAPEGVVEAQEEVSALRR